MTREEINEDKQKQITYENKKEIAKRIIKKIVKAIIIIAIIGFSFFAYTTYISTVKIQVKEYRIRNEKIPNSFDGIKILHFSDLHYGSTMFEENLKTIKKLINERKPDIIVFTGDLIDTRFDISSEQKEELTKKLKELNATLGKYAVLGDEDNEDVTTIYNQSDFITLKNEYELIYKETNEPILLIGLSSSLSGEQHLESAYSYFKLDTYNSNIYTITLVHEPDTTKDLIDNYNTDLILAGHSHNGNIVIPFINFPLERKEGAKKYNKEYYNLKDSQLYISSGLGTNNATGIRLFCRPSMNLYRLSSK